ncbi:hypothetical protein H4R35_006942, partial [Dimargaris xerosporica]
LPIPNTNLGSTSGTEYIVKVVNKLFKVLENPDLPTTFEEMIDPKPGEKRNSQDENSINQAPMAAGVEQPHNFRASMLRFWLEAIDNGDNSRLDYYLSNVLAFNVISRIIEQALEGGMDSKALAQAKKFSRMSGVEQIVGKFRENAPSCFEFIMLYATMLKVDGLDKLLQKTRRGNTSGSY